MVEIQRFVVDTVPASDLYPISGEDTRGNGGKERSAK